jgi:dTDP-4-amino-4,6-dideoxygalactose transaminase
MIPVNKIFYNKNEFSYIQKALLRHSISGRGFYSKKCEEFFKKKYNFNSFLTNSCTASLEAISILSDFNIGDEIIMPSYTFVGSATPFVLRGCVPVFVDIRADTQNIDEKKIEESITKKTKAILVVHYAGVSCELDFIKKLCIKHNLLLIEDAAQAIDSKYYNNYLGSYGDFSAFSFHDTKNLTSGEGGLLTINNKKFMSRAEIVIDKGTNRSKFLRGEIDKYTWRDVGSSYIQSEITAAFLNAQLEKIVSIQKSRKKIWHLYDELLKNSIINEQISLPYIPGNCKQNYHMYYIKFKSKTIRDWVKNYLGSHGIQAVSHYVPLHLSPAGKKLCKTYGDLSNTIKTSDTILRLPMWVGLKISDQEKIVNNINKCLKKKSKNNE